MNDKIKILGQDVEIVRLTLKGWSKLDELRQEIDDAVSTKRNPDEIVTLVCQAVETASKSIPENMKNAAWYELVIAYSEAVMKNQPTVHFPILSPSKNIKKFEKQAWEYLGRGWYFWLNLFAKSYGWGVDTVSNLDIDTALGLFQEIELDEQMRREWQYGLTEIAYPYNSSTKKSEFKPLERPNWMRPKVKPPKKVKIRRDLLPVGRMIKLDEEARKNGTKDADIERRDSISENT